MGFQNGCFFFKNYFGHNLRSIYCKRIAARGVLGLGNFPLRLIYRCWRMAMNRIYEKEWDVKVLWSIHVHAKYSKKATKLMLKNVVYTCVEFHVFSHLHFYINVHRTRRTLAYPLPRRWRCTLCPYFVCERIAI